MKPLSYITQDPNENIFEFDESHFEKAEVESPSFYDWYESRLLRFTTQGEHLKANILKQCYYKILHYQIDQSSCGYELCDYQLILQCSQLHKNYCKAYLLV